MEEEEEQEVEDIVVEGSEEWRNYYLLKKEALYEKLRDTRMGEMLLIEKPFDIDSFPFMNSMAYDEATKKGTLILPERDADGDLWSYEDDVIKYLTINYSKGEAESQPINKLIGVTNPRIFNIVANPHNLETHELAYNNDMPLVMKMVDLGVTRSTYAKNPDNGNFKLNEIYNEIRAGFFLNELRFAYPEVGTVHFMAVIDWFVSNHNYFTNEPGVGPYQYTVSERLHIPLSDYLRKYTSFESLLCALFSIAQALECAWSTNMYIHYDLHSENVMLKVNSAKSDFFGKNYVYTRAYDKRVYRLPATGTNNMLIKIIDFGRNHMHIPPKLETADVDSLYLYEHIDTEKAHDPHTHSNLIVYNDSSRGLGVPANRTWDLRRLLWDLLTTMSVEYWAALENENPEHFNNLMDQCEKIIDLSKIKSICNAERPKMNIDEIFLSKKERDDKVVFGFSHFAKSDIRAFYTHLKYFDAEYHSLNYEFEKKNRAYAVALEKFNFSQSEKEFKILFSKYVRWFSIVETDIIFQPHRTHTNATTFLSSNLFDHFVIKEDEVDTTTDEWAGKRPYSNVLPLRGFYVDPKLA